MNSFPPAMTGDAGLDRSESAPAHTGAFVALFAAAGLCLALAQPDAAATGVFAAFLSAMSAGMALIAAHDEPDSPFHKSMRTAVRIMAPALAAALLWVAISASQVVIGAGALGAAASVFAFLALIVLEGLASAALQVALSRLAGADPGVPAALLIADKYAGFAGELR